ncbi:unnamed protein product, partial [Polarella glacialis]
PPSSLRTLPACPSNPSVLGLRHRAHVPPAEPTVFGLGQPFASASSSATPGRTFASASVSAAVAMGVLLIPVGSSTSSCFLRPHRQRRRRRQSRQSWLPRTRASSGAVLVARATGSSASGTGASAGDTDEQVMFQESSQEGSALVTTAQEPLQEVAEWFFGWLRPKTFLPEKEMNKVRDFAQGLQRYAMVAEARAHKAEEELEKVAEERQLMAAELQRARKELQLISRYAEEVENERDSVQAELEALRSGSGAAFGAAQAEELAQLSRRIAQIAASASGSSGTAGVSAASGTAAVGAALPPPPSILATAMAASGTAAQEKVLQLPEGRSPGDMSLEELKAECAVWGLPADGPLAAVRGRIRAARARDRGRLGGS